MGPPNQANRTCVSQSEQWKQTQNVIDYNILKNAKILYLEGRALHEMDEQTRSEGIKGSIRVEY